MEEICKKNVELDKNRIFSSAMSSTLFGIITHICKGDYLANKDRFLSKCKSMREKYLLNNKQRLKPLQNGKLIQSSFDSYDSEVSWHCHLFWIIYELSIIICIIVNKIGRELDDRFQKQWAFWFILDIFGSGLKVK